MADDSLIRVATRYYEHRGPALHRLQAFYYHGRVLGNAGRHHEAMTAYTRAKEFVDEVDAPYQIGLLYLQIGVLYGYDYDYPEALVNMEYSLECFDKANNERLQYITKRNVGQYYLNMHQFAQADSLLNEVLAWNKIQNDSSLLSSIFTPLLRLYDATTNVEALDLLIMRYPIVVLPQNAATYGIIAHYYALKGDDIIAKNALAYAWSISAAAEDTADLWNKSYQIGKLLGDKEMALRSHEFLLAHQDSIVRVTLQQPLIASQRDHYEARLKVEELRNQQQRYLMRGVAAIVLAAAIVVGIFVYRFFRRKDRQLMEQIELADELRRTIYNKEQDLDKMSNELRVQRTTFDKRLCTMDQQISQLLRARYKLLDELSKTYYENQANHSDKEKIYKKVMGEIKRLSMDQELEQLEDIVNEYCDNVMARIRAELPKAFSKIDYQLLCCFYIGFSGKSISVFTGIQVNQIPVYKQRFRERIYKSNAPSKQLMLDKMK